MIIEENNCLIVNVWLQNNDQIEAHVSIQTSEIYLSAWPENHYRSQVERHPLRKMSYEEDCILEDHKKPDKVFSFYSLNINKLVERYEMIEQLTKDCPSHMASPIENLHVSLLSKRDIEYGNSNSSLCWVWKLLMVAGIGDLDESQQSFWNMDYVPDFNVANFLKSLNKVKSNELNKYRETAGFDNNIGLVLPKRSKKIGCGIL